MVSFSQAPPLPLTFALFTLHSFVFASALEANASICSVFALWSMGSSSTISLRISWALPPVHLNELSTTPDHTNGEPCFTIIHPFHPLSGQMFLLLSQSYAWGEERVFFTDPQTHKVRSLPLKGRIEHFVSMLPQEDEQLRATNPFDDHSLGD